jgi:hypothetical protein
MHDDIIHYFLINIKFIMKIAILVAGAGLLVAGTGTVFSSWKAHGEGISKIQGIQDDERRLT